VCRKHKFLVQLNCVGNFACEKVMMSGFYRETKKYCNVNWNSEFAFSHGNIVIESKNEDIENGSVVTCSLCRC